FFSCTRRWVNRPSLPWATATSRRVAWWSSPSMQHLKMHLPRPRRCCWRGSRRSHSPTWPPILHGGMNRDDAKKELTMRYDVIVIGGGYAGMAAALQLVRARRSVLVIDAGERRNRFASHSHGFLGQDGVDA